jgi:hypothetical protein
VLQSGAQVGVFQIHTEIDGEPVEPAMIVIVPFAVASDDIGSDRTRFELVLIPLEQLTPSNDSNALVEQLLD